MNLNSDQIKPDELNIDTPELVDIQMPLAGIGSRFIALLVDTLIWIAGFLLLLALLAIFLPGIAEFSNISAEWAFAIFLIIIFLLFWGYFTLFEAFWNGRTPGKRAARIRVIQRSGRAIGLIESMTRNLVRYVDMQPFPFYAVGVIAIFATRQHQRLGDLAAGTLVVRDRLEEAPLWGESGARTFTAQIFAPDAPPLEPHTAYSLPATGIARLTSTDLEVLEGFFARRLDLSLPTRYALAERIAAAIKAKSGLEPPVGASTETFLEATARQLRDQARMQ
ncbi:MAG TPA: RDD family protein [Terracidiphilus sp.]|nr:RDD family protein [Terracidiphilus sp.]